MLLHYHFLAKHYAALLLCSCERLYPCSDDTGYHTIFTAQHAWQSKSSLSVFTKRCLWTLKQEHYIFKYTGHNALYFIVPQKVPSCGYKTYSSKWSVYEQGLPPYYHQNTKPRDLRELVTKLPCETAKGKLHFLQKVTKYLTTLVLLYSCESFAFQW